MASGPTVSSDATADIRRLIADAGITQDADLIARILATGVGLGLDDSDRLDLKITSAALTEMRAAFALFAPYRGMPKVTVFGSARTAPESELYRLTVELTSALAGHGWMTVTGAGPGIMQAAAEGAGPEHSLGVSIRLPFEEKPNAVIASHARNVVMKYFFTRKLMLVKESSGFVCMPGGFGTLDEMFELLTLQQTGKAAPTPIVLLDRPGGGFWDGLRRFADEQLIPEGVISPDDLARVLITDSVDAAVAEITGFYRNFVSLRWVRQRLVLRLRAEPTDAEVADLNARFGSWLTAGDIQRRGPLKAEIEDGDTVEAPRLVMRYDSHRVGDLFQLIGAVNSLPSAPAVGRPA
ncbi:LOG family protein [Microbacterium dextranolyticum]|uniref:Rossman fold protein, TIGR00730 family n=1 Tax=Microbacterium dextranolyticum TaxID=36806 RepID=A0A9W6HNJ2_9MICO|nr:TIGR00730 family Rossman fold protein [Microbacterium dextranolyticum]MBM7463610.1 uncharacterized protein (TIGR00730 family) [Microbacterium dextranolyticum]GLJ96560.1 Rossman fold protein, TIGR00730 family [Microbacterium dextranolyticum]